MLIFLHRTHRGKTYKWWLQSTTILMLLVFLAFLMTYCMYLYLELHSIEIEAKNREVQLVESRQASRVQGVNEIHEYWQYLNRLEKFEKIASLAKWMKIYHSQETGLDRQKRNLEQILIRNMVLPVMSVFAKELGVYTQYWEKKSLSEKNEIQVNFRKSTLAYMMLAKLKDHEIVSSEALREKIIECWFNLILNQVEQSTANNQEIYVKLEHLVDFYFQIPKRKNTGINLDTALLEKSKKQLNLYIIEENNEKIKL